MTNQEVVDYVRTKIAEKESLSEICESMMDHCLAPDSEVGGVGCDNMSIIIIAILNGKTVDEWYNWMASRIPKTTVDSLGNEIKITSTNDQEENKNVKEQKNAAATATVVIDEKIDLVQEVPPAVVASPVVVAETINEKE